MVVKPRMRTMAPNDTEIGMSGMPFINGGQPLHGIPDIPISVSLGAIVLILGVTTIASLLKSSRDRKAAERTAAQSITDPTEDDHPDW